MATPLRLLAIEDSEVDYMFILRELKRGGFKVAAERVQTAATVEAALREKKWDLIISDYSMPDFDGIAALALYKSSGLDLPFIIVSGAIGEEIAAATMAAGAHDYVLKRNLARLVPAVVRELREAEGRRQRRRAEQELLSRAEQQAAVSELGQAALQVETDLSALLDRAVALVAKTLGVELAKVMEILPDRNAMRMRAGVGWRADVQAGATTGLDRTSQAGFTLFAAGPVVVNDVRTETRFAVPPLLVAHGVVSGMSVVIRGAQEPWGILGAHSTRPRQFDQNDVHFLQSVANVLSAAIVRQQATTALRQSHSRFELVVQGTNDGLWDWNVETDEVYFSPRWKAMLGYGEPEVQPHISEWKRLLHPADAERVLESIRATLAGQAGQFELEYRMQHRDGGIRWILSRGVIVRGENGAPRRMVGSNEDLTERKRADEELRESDERFRLLVEGVKDYAIIMLDPAGNVLNWNPGAERIKGYTAEQIIGKHFSTFYPPEEVAQGRPTMEIELATVMGHFEDEGWSVRQDGSRFWANFVLTALRNKAGELRGFGLVTHDVTERSQAEATLRRSEEKYRSIVRNIPDVTWTANVDGQITFISPNVGRLLGFSPDEMEQGGAGHWFGRIQPDDLPRVRAAYAALFAQGTKFEVEYRYQRKDGQLLWVSNRAVGTYEVEGLMLADGLLSDITEKKLSDAALRQSEERFQLVARATNDAVWDWDLRTNDLWWNEGYQSLFGYQANEIEPGVESWYRKLHPDDAPRVVQGIQQFIETGGQLWSDEYRFQRRDGSYATIYARGCVIRNPEGKAVRMIGAMQDVTERRGADEALRLLGSAVHQASESILITTGELAGAGPTILFANPAFTKMTGHDSATVVGQPLSILQGPKTDLAVLDRLQQSLAAGQSFLGETVHYRKDGSEFIMEWQINPIRDKNGAVTHFVAIQRDITARKQAEQKIVEQASLLDLAQDAIVVRDLAGRIEFWNQGAERMFGWPAAAAVGRRVAELHFKDPAAYDEAQKLLLEKGEWNGELKQLNQAGKFVTVNSRWTLVRDPRGQPKSVLAISSDITEKKQIEAQFLRAQRMDSIGTLASGVAHDLNNILAPIMMSVPMFRAGLKPEENERLIETIETSAQRGAAIVKQLLAFGRGVEGERVVIQIRHVINEMVTIAKETFPKNITIASKVAKDLWAIKADPTHLHQVLLNLCVNARDAMPNGGSLTLRAENMMLDEGFLAARPDLKPGPFIQLESVDTGTGIPPEIMDKLFDPFFTTKEVGKGTGLGLSTVLGIIKSHGGFVNVYSEVGKGTRFQIFFPALPQTEAGSGKTEQAALPAGKNETVLLVDDEAGIRESVTRILTRHNYRVLAAADGAEAVALFSQNRDAVRVVFTDLMMPVMDGMALVRVVQKMDPNMKFIASSGLEQDEKFEELKRCGVKMFLTKPYTAEKLLKGLREVLGD